MTFKSEFNSPEFKTVSTPKPFLPDLSLLDHPDGGGHTTDLYGGSIITAFF